MSDALQIYRFTVRCDRDTNAAIEKAAKAAGLSPTSFVQRHFDGIVVAADSPATQEPTPASVSRRDIERARDLGLSVGEMRVLDAIALAADRDGNAEIGVGSIATATALTEGSVRNILSKLAARNMIRRIGKPGFRRTTIYHVEAARR